MHSRIVLIFLLIQLVITSSFAAKQSFFEQRYRGWLWFEEIENKDNIDDAAIEHQLIMLPPTHDQVRKAKLENEAFKEQLEGLRHMIVRHPDNLYYIRLYKEKEKEMLEAAMTLASNFAMVNFLNPDIADQLTTPQNIYGRNVARNQKEQQQQQILKALADKIELFVFRQENCPHCPLLEKHLNAFAIEYGFKVEAVAQDNSTSSYFKTHNNPAIIKQLALTVMPTVIAVTNDSSMRFELARGAVAIPDLEDKALLLAEFLNKQHQQVRAKN